MLVCVFIDLSNVRGLAIDWLSRNMYWMNSDNDETHINVARLNGSLKSTIVHGMDKPKGLVLHPSKGYSIKKIHLNSEQYTKKEIRVGQIDILFINSVIAYFHCIVTFGYLQSCLRTSDKNLIIKPI